MKSWAMVIAGFSVVLVAAGGAAALGIARSHSESRERKERARDLDRGPVVDVSPIVEAPAFREVTLPAEVHALVESTIYAKVSGYLKLIHVDKGDRVTRSEILGVVEAPEVTQQVLSKRADLAIKRITETRAALLEHNGLASEQDVDQARAAVKIDEEDLKQLEYMSGYQVIRAPFDGVVTARFADPGALLQAATQSTSALPLVSIANLDRVRVQAFLAQSDAFFVHPGDHVAVWADERPDVRADATVTRIASELDARTRTMLTEVEMDNAKTAFYPGAVVRVRFSLPTPPALAVPSDTLIESGGKFVIATVADDRVRFVPVDVVETTGVDTKVRAAAKPGDQVVRHPSDDVVDGARVRPRPATK